MKRPVGGNNNLKPEFVEKIADLTKRGYSMREIRRETGIAMATIERHQKLLDLDGIDCPCGQPVRHRGYCPVRYARYEERQRYQRTRGWQGIPMVETCETVSVEDLDETYLGAP
jgi:hypothetical protein